MGLYYHEIGVQPNEPAKLKLRKHVSMLLISDVSYGASALLLKRFKTLILVNQNLPAGESLEFSVDSDELTLNILYSQRSSGLRIVEI